MAGADSWAATPAGASLRRVRTSMLDCAYEEWGDPAGRPAVLLHGFPYDPRAYDEVAPALASEGLRVIVPYLRGYGPTRFLREDQPRSGEQAALGADLIDLIEALGLSGAILVGYDWGGRAACIAAATRPDRVAGLVTGGGYNIFGPGGRYHAFDAETAHRMWYAYLLQGPAGANLFAHDPVGFSRYIWGLWSPTWQGAEEAFARSAESFRNPDYAAVVIHSYRHRAGLVDGDPQVAKLARSLEDRPVIGVPTVVLCGGDDTVQPPASTTGDERLARLVERRVLSGVGHNIPQEAPGAVAEAVRRLAEMG